MQEASPMVAGIAPSVLTLVAIVAGVIFFFMVFLTAVLKQRQKEVTVREVAAYVAEGSISAADAERILRGSRRGRQLREISQSRATSAGPRPATA